MTDRPDLSELGNMIEVEGNLIAFHFTLKDPKGIEIDSNVGKDPMIFQTGTDQMLPALEEVLITMEVGESRSVMIPVAQAYGEVTEKAYKKFPLDSIPAEAREVGRKVCTRSRSGEEETFDVVGIHGDEVTLDFNHPLAGLDLYFDVTIVSNESLS